MPFILEYEKGEIPLPMTGATALSAGWMWDIPLATRRGCGYVFDSNFITHEEAQSEVESYLGKKIKPIKFINFEAGRGTEFWKGNVLALGLSAAFVEPLEATSIHSTIIQLLIFVKEYLLTDQSATITETNQYSYNLKISRLYDSFMEFISFHYQGGRTDTPFWQSIQREKKISPLAKVYLEKCRHMIPGFLEINGIIGSPAASLWNWIAAGLGLITSSQAEKELQESNWMLRAKTEYDRISKNNKSYIKYY
jgi:tryptophan halogenase